MQPELARLQICCFCSVAKSCLTPCNPMDYSLPGSSAHGVFQARILEWVAISFSRGSSQARDQTHVSYIGLYQNTHSQRRRKKNLQRLYLRYPTVPVRRLPFALCSRILTISIWTSLLQRNVKVTGAALHRNPQMTNGSQGLFEAASSQMLVYKLNNKGEGNDKDSLLRHCMLTTN